MHLLESRFGKILLIVIALLAINAAFISPAIWTSVAGLLPALFLGMAFVDTSCFICFTKISKRMLVTLIISTLVYHGSRHWY